MKYSIVLLGMLSFVGLQTKAQITDTLNLSTNAFYGDWHEQLQDNPLLFARQNLQDYTLTQLSYTHKDYAFKRVQTPDKINEYSFITQGVYRTDSQVLLFGDVNFSQIYQDGMGYNLSNYTTEHQNVLPPNYFMAPKKGAWEIQKYFINAGASYAYRGFLFAGKIHYNNQNNVRTVDPRPQSTLIDFGGELHLGYNYKNHLLGVIAGKSRNTQTSSITYMNQWQNAPVYVDTYTRFSSGYGRMVFNSSFPGYINRITSDNLGLTYGYQQGAQLFSLRYLYSKSMDNLYNRDANDRVYIDKDLIAFKYRVKTHEFSASFYRDAGAFDYMASLEYSSQQGDNYSVIEQGQNYRMTLDQLTAKAGLIKQDKDITTYAVQAYGQVAKHRYIDLLGYTDKKLTTLELGIAANKDFQVNANAKFTIGVSVGCYSALDEGLLYNPLSATNYFVTSVVMPDHGYDVTSKLLSKIEVNYLVKLNNSRLLCLFVNADSRFALDKKYQKYTHFDQTQSGSVNLGVRITY